MTEKGFDGWCTCAYTSKRQPIAAGSWALQYLWALSTCTFIFTVLFFLKIWSLPSCGWVNVVFFSLALGRLTSDKCLCVSPGHVCARPPATCGRVCVWEEFIAASVTPCHWSGFLFLDFPPNTLSFLTRWRCSFSVSFHFGCLKSSNVIHILLAKCEFFWDF